MDGMSRRRFAESVVTGALVPLLGVGAVPGPAWWATLPDAEAAVAPGDLDALAEALTAAVRAQFGDRLSEADLAVVTRQIRTSLERAEQIRKVELGNGDEPDSVFFAPPPRS